MIIRKANNNDKEEILKLCRNTFSWGDYIHTVWDSWLSDPYGLLLIVEVNINEQRLQPIAMSHVVQCPNNFLWIEGIRVNQNYRKQGIASSLLKYMINIGIKVGNAEANAIVSHTNLPSQKMFEKHGFSKLLEFAYYNTNLINADKNKIFLSHFINKKVQIKIPNSKDISSIIVFLEHSKTYEYFKRRLFNSWKFYLFSNTYPSILSLINYNKLLLFTNDLNQIIGMSIINAIEKEESFYNRPTIQICYLDCINCSDYTDAVNLLLSYYLNCSKYKYLQFCLPNFIKINNPILEERSKHFEKFILYSKNLKQ